MKNNQSNKSLLRSCLISQLFFICSAAVMLLIICAICVGGNDPEAAIKPLTLTVLYVSSFISGIAAVKKSGDGIVSGALSGVFTSIMIMILSFIPFPPSGYDSLTSLLCSLLVIPASVLGAIVGHRKESKKSSLARIRKKIR